MSDDSPVRGTELHGDAVVVRMAGEVDLANVDEVQARLRGIAAGASRMVVDLSAVEYIDSQGLRVLSRLADELAANDASLALVAPVGSVARDVLELTRMDEQIPISDALPGLPG